VVLCRYAGQQDGSHSAQITAKACPRARLSSSGTGCCRSGPACGVGATARLTVVAGANGAGKSTLTREITARGTPIIDPDAIARDERRSAVGAGRAAIVASAAHFRARESFGIETTLSGNRTLRLMRDAQFRGYEIVLLFIGTNSVEINLARIRARVALGGHDVPEADVRRRYERGFESLRQAFAIASGTILYDNSSTPGYEIVALTDDRRRLMAIGRIPPWARPFVDR
jgi:predicted ABC-type ATPase